MKTYVIARSGVFPDFSAKVGSFPEDEAHKVQISEFLKESSAHRPRTEVALVYTDDGLWGKFKVNDRYVRCVHTTFQDPVYQDACVEFFVQPAGAQSYFNFEFNACGTLLASHVLNPEKDKNGLPREFIPLTVKDLEDIKVRGSLPAPVVEEITEAVTWTLEFFISFDLLARYISDMKRPAYGDVWRGNFYKCAENNSHPHWAAWAPVDAFDFHLPRCFGELVFA